MVWHQYNDRGSIFVLDDYHPYRMEVVRYLDLIGSIYSGQTLFHYCNTYSERRIEIIPFVPTAAFPVNAGTERKNINDSFVHGAPVRKSDGTVVTPDATGTGLGSDVTVEYHPANQRQFCANMHSIPPGGGPGEMLFHELIHAMRAVHGVWLRTAIPESSKFVNHTLVFPMGNFEEFCSIAASNVYRSERGFKIMRDSHLGFHPLKNELSVPDLYYDCYKDEFKKWFLTQQNFCMALARSHAAFNPFKFAAMDLKLIAAPRPSMRL
jgi:Effector protein